VSLRLYPHFELDAEGIVAELLAQGRLADEAGFDGVMTSEHHNAFGGYLPIPLLLAGWLLDVMPEAWAAPCPLLLTLRPAALVAEEVAWLAARFPGRVGLGVAAGALKEDFAVMGLTKERLSDRFASGLATVSGMLLGRDPGPLSDDPAIRRCVTHPVPLVSAAMSPAAVRRAADAGVGLVLDSLSGTRRCLCGRGWSRAGRVDPAGLGWRSARAPARKAAGCISQLRLAGRSPALEGTTNGDG
jgi:alkanesulfonate monooxygenase SsuD/methylene tetrahydromethanopterin reductase-like flavin-dependent oxidoreductase (luciferase family)